MGRVRMKARPMAMGWHALSTPRFHPFAGFDWDSLRNGHRLSRDARRMGRIKVMGMSPLGDPARFAPVFDRLVRLRSGGQYETIELQWCSDPAIAIGCFRRCYACPGEAMRTRLISSTLMWPPAFKPLQRRSCFTSSIICER